MTDELNADDSVVEDGATEAAQEASEEVVESNEELPEEVFYEIDDEEVSLDTIKQWKAGHMKDADYTQKTQKLSEESKALAGDRATVTERLTALDDLDDEITNLALGKYADIDLDDLLENEGSEAVLKAEREIKKRTESISNLQKKRQALKEQLLAENHIKLVESLGWSDQEKQKQDSESIMNYVKGSAITDTEFNRIDSPGVIEAILKAAKYDKLMADKPEIMKKVKLAPKINKPNGASEDKKPKSLAERMYGTN